MSRNLRLLLAITILITASLACSRTAVNTAVPQPTSAATTASSNANPVEVIEPTLAPTDTPEDNSVADPDLANAVLTVNDLPGFQELSSDELATLGLDQTILANTFKETLKNAEPQSFNAFLNSTNFELLLTFVLAPLTLVEKAAFDYYLSDPNGAVQDFGQGANSATTQALEGMEDIGDSSVGITFTSGQGNNTMRGDVTISRRGSAVVVCMVFYPVNSTPPVTVRQAADLMDQRVLAALK